MSVSGTYQLGETEGALADINQPPSNSTYNRVTLGSRADGAPYVSAYAEVEWTWQAMSQVDYNQLYAYYDAADPDMYIRTRIESGATISYANFSAIMLPPTSQMDHTFRKNIVVKFIKVLAA